MAYHIYTYIIFQYTIQYYLLIYQSILDLENYYYTRCTSMCVNLKEDLLNDKERECLNDCNRKISKYIGIARK